MMIPETQQSPMDIQAERSLLGAILSRPEVLDEIVTSLRPHHFYLVPHQEIYSACLELFLHQQPIDAGTVAVSLDQTHKLEMAGGRAGLWSIQSEGFAHQNATFYTEVVVSLYRKRQIIDIARQTISRGLNNGVEADEFLDETLAKYFALTTTAGKQIERLGDNAISDYLTIIQNGEVPRLAWPWQNLDNLLHGLRPGEITVIGGRPGSGKTALAMCLTLDLAMNKKKSVGIFSLEMSKMQLVNRMLSQLATVDSAELQDAKITSDEWKRVLEASGPLAEAPIYINDNSSLTEMDLVNESRKMRHQFKVDCLIVDYLQLLKGTGKSGNREQEVSSFVQTTKRVARELDTSVVVLSSLNRDPERREDHRPIISDFRESGGIENEADVILGLYREFYYNPTANPQNAEVIVLKHRNGPTGTCKLKFEKKYTYFWSEE